MKKRKRINNRKQLRERLYNLQENLPLQEENIKQNYNHLKESLRPQNLLIHSIASITGLNINKKEFLRDGLAAGLSLVLQRVVSKTEAAVENKVYHVVDLLFKKIDDLIHRFASRNDTSAQRIESEEH